MLAAFDGTTNEIADLFADLKSGDTNVVRFAALYKRLTGLEVEYHPGVGTRLGKVGRAAGILTGAGWRGRARAQLSVTLRFGADEPQAVVFFSRGYKSARKYADDYYARTGKLLDFWGGFDAVDSAGLDVYRRLLPRRLWEPPTCPRPPARVVCHVTGPAPVGIFRGGRPSARWFVPTVIERGSHGEPVDVLSLPGTDHSYRGRSDEALEWMWERFLESIERPVVEAAGGE